MAGCLILAAEITLPAVLRITGRALSTVDIRHRRLPRSKTGKQGTLLRYEEIFAAQWWC